MRASGRTLALIGGGVLALGAAAIIGGGVRAVPDPAPPAISPAATFPPGRPVDRTQSSRVFLAPQDAERGADAGLLPPGVHSILDVRDTMRHGEYHWDDAGVPPGPLAIRVDVDRQLISVFRGGHEIGTAVALYGIDGKETPLGHFPIKDKREDYHSHTYDAPMPYSLWLTDDGVAVHGSSVRGGRATNGCVGVPIEFARRLFAAAKIGDVVEVVASGRKDG